MLRFQYNFIYISGITKWGIFSAKSGYFYYAIHNLTDMSVKEIFRTLGYDPEMLGTKRTDGFVYNLRKERLTNEQRLNSVSRTSKVRHPPSDVKYSDMKSKEAIKAMEIELTYLRQEVNFLKKLYSLLPQQIQEEE